MNAAAPRRPERILVAPTATAFLRLAGDLFTDLTREALSARGRVHVALAGGSTPRPLYELLAAPPFSVAIPWPHIHFWFGDERAVPPDHAWSNFRMAQESLFAPLSPPGRKAVKHIHRIQGELDATAAAQAYDQELARQFPDHDLPILDLILLGLGPDGHTASLFPGRDWHSSRVLAVQAPGLDPKVDRISLSLPLINAARNVVFLVTGAAKADLVAAILSHAPETAALPSAQVKPASGAHWILDADAARALKTP